MSRFREFNIFSGICHFAQFGVVFGAIRVRARVCVCGWVGGCMACTSVCVLVYLCACEYVHVCVHACACASHMVCIHAHNVYRYQSLQLINGSKVLGM